MLESPIAFLFEKHGLYLSLQLSQPILILKGFELAAMFKFSKYSFLCFLLSLTTKLRCLLYLDRSAGHCDLLASFFSRERFMMAHLQNYSQRKYKPQYCDEI